MGNNFTPHINASKGDFAKTVLMPGDPLRSKYIVENFLENAVLVNNVRGVQGYTGTYKNKKVSVMASGMGMPSIAIYSYELFKFFDVENIIRIGSAGAMQEKINLRDIVIGMSASTDSNIAEKFGTPGIVAPTADYEILEKCVENARKENIKVHIGNILSSDLFYSFEDYLPENSQSLARWKDMGVLAVEMEAASLYLNAKRLNKKALAICTISNHLMKDGELTAKEREKSFDEMIKLSLETAIDLE